MSAVFGLDAGTSRIVVAHKTAGEIVYRSELNAFAAVPYSALAEGALERESIPHTARSGEILVYGNESETFAGLLNSEIRRPMKGGVLDPKEPDSLGIIGELWSTTR